MKKSYLSIVLDLALAVTVTACGGGQTAAPADNAQAGAGGTERIFVQPFGNMLKKY